MPNTRQFKSLINVQLYLFFDYINNVTPAAISIAPIVGAMAVPRKLVAPKHFRAANVDPAAAFPTSDWTTAVAEPVAAQVEVFKSYVIVNNSTN